MAKTSRKGTLVVGAGVAADRVRAWIYRQTMKEFTMKNMRTITQVHELTGINKKTLRNWANAGKITAVRIGPMWVISLDEAIAFRSTSRPGPKPKRDLDDTPNEN
jgi:hypothetical protein